MKKGRSSMIVLPNSTTDTSIITQTREGHNITNSQCREFSAFERNQFPDYRRDYKMADFRTVPNPIYNCHGLVFGSKRTGIHESAVVSMILHEDGYTLVQKNEAGTGDVIIYFDASGDFEHSGIVLSWDKSLNVPLVLSKWGKYSEVVHWGHDCPYNFANVRYYRVTK